MNEFKINKYITLRLEGSITVIYVKGKRFDQCKYLLFNIVKGDQMAKKIDSIDEMEEYLEDKLEYQEIMHFDIEPEEEFQAHCSNIQAWAENDYDTRILHRNLAFPLLKRLYQEGDVVARRVFKDEVAQRVGMGTNNTILFLCIEGYLEVFNGEEFDCLLEENKKNLNELRDYLISKEINLNVYMISFIIKSSRKLNLEKELIKNKLLLSKFLATIVSILKDKRYNWNHFESNLITDIVPIILKMLTHKMKDDLTNIVVLNEALNFIDIFLKPILKKENRYLKEKNFHYLLKKYFEQKNFEVKINSLGSQFCNIHNRSNSGIEIGSINSTSKNAFYYNLITMNFPTNYSSKNYIFLEIIGDALFNDGICINSYYYPKDREFNLITLVYNEDLSNIDTMFERSSL